MPPFAGLVLLLACRGLIPTSPRALEPDPDARFVAAGVEAARLVPSPTRGGPGLIALASPLPPFTGVDRATADYRGASACAGCHADEHAIWTASAHAGAWEPLEREAASLRPDCVGCHSTGYLQPTGFRDTAGAGARTGPAPGASALIHVGCEACHGPGSDHVKEQALGGSATSAPSAAPPYGTLPSSMAACVACHTWERSPEFHFVEAWAKIAH